MQETQNTTLLIRHKKHKNLQTERNNYLQQQLHWNNSCRKNLTNLLPKNNKNHQPTGELWSSLMWWMV
jgi:hypothetical protein